MAAKIHFAAYCIFDPDNVGFVVDPSLFNVNRIASFSCSCFTQKMDKLLTDHDRHDFVKWTLIAFFNDVFLACRLKSLRLVICW